MRHALAILVLLSFPAAWAGNQRMATKTWTGCKLLKKEHYPLAVAMADLLKQQGVRVLQIADSKMNGFFKNWHEACWIKTNQGVLEAVFFPDAAPGSTVKFEKGTSKDGMHVYKVTSPDGESVEMQGMATQSFVGPHVWLSTSSESLATTLSQVVGLP